MEEWMKQEKIPQTDSIKEISDFWDTHDNTTYANELEEVHKQIFDNSKEVSIKLDSNEIDEIEKLAKGRGISNADLIHEWVREKLKAA
jgi:hypothetical protein